VIDWGVLAGAVGSAGPTIAAAEAAGDEDDDELEPPPLLPQAAASSASEPTAAAEYTKRNRLATGEYSLTHAR
jgi:hypothetical protein